MSGNAAALAMSQAIPRPRDGTDAGRPPSGLAEWRERLAALDLVPDLGADIGIRTWWRGLATLTLLCGSAIATFLGIRPLAASGAQAPDDAGFNAARSAERRVGPGWVSAGRSRVGRRPCKKKKI